jgi:hypothetical protein
MRGRHAWARVVLTQDYDCGSEHHASACANLVDEGSAIVSVGGCHRLCSESGCRDRLALPEQSDVGHHVAGCGGDGDGCGREGSNHACHRACRFHGGDAPAAHGLSQRSDGPEMNAGEQAETCSSVDPWEIRLPLGQ